MNRIVLTYAADEDVDDIWLNIAIDNLGAADRFVDSLYEVMRKLVSFPGMGRAADTLRPGVRVFAHRDYLIVYRPMTYGIAVLRVSHGARNISLLDFPPAPPEDQVLEPQLEY